MIDGKLIMDVWTEHEGVYFAGGLSHDDTSICGYSYTGLPNVSETSGRVRTYTFDQPESWWRGRNKWAQLACRLRDATGAQYGRVMINGDDRLGAVWVGTAGGDTYTVYPVGDLFDLGVTGTRFAPPSEITPIGSDDPIAIAGVAGRFWIPRPAGVWSPCQQQADIRSDGVEVAERTAESPFSALYDQRLIWGGRYPTFLMADIIPAADIFSLRAANIPCPEWAERAGREAFRSRSSVLEYLWPWMLAARAQDESRSWWEPGGASPSEVIRAGHPIVVYLDEYGFGRGNAMRLLTTRSYNGSPDNIDANDDHVMHVTLPAGARLSDYIEDRGTLNRLFRFHGRFYDVTPHLRREEFAESGASRQLRRLPRGYNTPYIPPSGS